MNDSKYIQKQDLSDSLPIMKVDTKYYRLSPSGMP